MYKDILMPVDLGDENSWRALPVCAEYAKAFKSTLHEVTVVPDFGMSIVGSFFPANFEHQALKQAGESLHAWVSEHVPKGIKVQHIVAHGTAYEEILRVSEEINCDLIVMASHRPKAEDYLIGPNAARVVRHANCSVLVVRD